MVAHLSTILSSPLSALGALLAICYRVPKRVLRNVLLRLTGNDPGTSLWLAISSSLFSAGFDYNWRLVLVKPRWMDRRDGFAFPASASEKDDFVAYLYVNEQVKGSSTMPTLAGADAVWIHAHGGGFMAGEARQYHNTYKRWVNKAKDNYGIDLRILAVDYRQSC